MQKKKKGIETFLEYLKDSAKLKCHNKGSSYLENNWKGLRGHTHLNPNGKEMQLETA